MARLAQHVRAIVAGAAIDAQAHGHAGIEHAAHRRDAAGQAHIAARAMRHAGAGGGKQADAMVVQLDTMRMPNVLAQPAQVLRILRRGAAEFF